jgi:hypothetical protein
MDIIMGFRGNTKAANCGGPSLRLGESVVYVILGGQLNCQLSTQAQILVFLAFLLIWLELMGIPTTILRAEHG